MLALERGFKSWAERTSLGVRRELGLTTYDPLQPTLLAEYLEVRLCTPRDISGLPRKILHQLLEVDPWGWSAVTQLVRGKALVIYNPHHSEGRRASNIMHELAHLILEHEPSKIVMSQDGAIVMRSFDRRQEDEANWLGWCLLLPREAIVHAVRSVLDVSGIAERYGVTEKLVRFRIQVTGVRAQFAFTKHSRASR